ncbi:hypothetical protein AYX14_01897 [Cryptococcus neoformans]|uniref:Ion transport domain-containing protein n=1 Tax=Cryptococcus neoformans Tu259-1 TaxID=1230072 RepID=A0A854QC72_CRYNE|nr:hypothetical protein C353_02546 [Cryptococcus neoformans var. grubii AD1-83a]OWZ54910.1 hypothetical protein C368_03139 [Cryptococcus neoformans var. grubii 125.91]OWZ72719.1 hypothetical protein AYX14_01897 [Cryptococcus neoformans var. grubii]OXG23113.1 hypothetical protein C361_02880 [Cryptococcus neoformans var. grubii Tu259-1]OXG35125.1 hypothetical protein C360_03141 [Cryptococcus neoformans var. grubii Bt15]OXG43055.1 hypothetical protein C359_01882 [Cryptococcus neoformans var. grub
MSQQDPEAQPLTAEDFDFDQSSSFQDTSRPVPSRSPYHLPASEQLQGVANRIIFSRYYILFYGAMMALSLATLVLSLVATHKGQCPPIAWHIIEFVLNALMVLEVTTRWIANGRKYPMTALNIIDLTLVFFCTLTLVLVFLNPCGSGTRKEELLDTILIVARNTVQFLRLGSILRRSGHSWLNPPKPIDLSQARDASRALDFDLDDEEDTERRFYGDGRGRSLLSGRRGYEPVSGEEERRGGAGVRDNSGREQFSEQDDHELLDRL